jgi:hypothetical protein
VQSLSITGDSKKHFWSDVTYAALIAGIFGGIPSTLLAYFTGKDILEATHAAGAMLIAADSSSTQLFMAATLVHGSLTFFWATVLTLCVPRKHAVSCSCILMILVGFFNLSIIAPHFFPSVAALQFWPQMMDHAALGFCYGAILYWRYIRRVNYRKRHGLPDA